jgi:hypothetical protein
LQAGLIEGGGNPQSDALLVLASRDWRRVQQRLSLGKLHTPPTYGKERRYFAHLEFVPFTNLVVSSCAPEKICPQVLQRPVTSRQQLRL